MKSFDRETIHYLTQLCRIKFNEQEEESFAMDLQKILQYFEELNMIDTEHVKPLNFVVESCSITTREDVAENSLSHKDYLANAPDQVAGMIKVPSVIKSSS